MKGERGSEGRDTGEPLQRLQRLQTLVHDTIIPLHAQPAAAASWRAHLDMVPARSVACRGCLVVWSSEGS